MADLQRAEAAVKGLLEPRFDRGSETLSAAAAKKRQAGEVRRKGAQVVGVAVDAGQPATPYWFLGLVLLREHMLLMDLLLKRGDG